MRKEYILTVSNNFIVYCRHHTILKKRSWPRYIKKQKESFFMPQELSGEDESYKIHNQKYWIANA